MLRFAGGAGASVASDSGGGALEGDGGARTCAKRAKPAARQAPGNRPPGEHHESPSRGSEGHHDLAAAWNVAMALCTTDQQKQSVLAIWLFVHPDRLDAVVARMMQMLELPSEDISHYLHRPKGARLTDRMLRELVGEFSPHVRVLCQRHGTAIFVPIGWLHMVVNVAPCFKYVRGVKQHSDLLAAALVRRQLRSECGSWAVPTYDGPPKDYLSVSEHLRNVIAEISNVKEYLDKLLE